MQSFENILEVLSFKSSCFTPFKGVHSFLTKNVPKSWLNSGTTKL